MSTLPTGSATALSKFLQQKCITQPQQTIEFITYFHAETAAKSMKPDMHCIRFPVLQVNDDDADVVLVVPPDGEPGQEPGGAEAPGLLPVASSDRSSWCSCSCSGDEGGRVGARMDPVLQIPKSLPESPDP